VAACGASNLATEYKLLGNHAWYRATLHRELALYQRSRLSALGPVSCHRELAELDCEQGELAAARAHLAAGLRLLDDWPFLGMNGRMAYKKLLEVETKLDELERQAAEQTVARDARDATWAHAQVVLARQAWATNDLWRARTCAARACSIANIAPVDRAVATIIESEGRASFQQRIDEAQLAASVAFAAEIDPTLAGFGAARLARLDLQRGDHSAAQTNFEAAASHFGRGRAPLELAEVLLELATLVRADGDLKQALAIAERASDQALYTSYIPKDELARRNRTLSRARALCTSLDPTWQMNPNQRPRHQPRPTESSYSTTNSTDASRPSACAVIDAVPGVVA
jgi:tetratricopeptide (TPR) repeat protein